MATGRDSTVAWVVGTLLALVTAMGAAVWWVSGEPGAPTAGRFDTDPVDHAVGLDPSEQRGVAGRGGRERPHVELAAGRGVEHRGDVDVAVGVDPAGDATVW